MKLSSISLSQEFFVEKEMGLMFIEIGQGDGLDETAILKRIQEKIGLSLEEALDCMKLYGKQQA